MRKYFLAFGICILIVIIFLIFYFRINSSTSLSCKSQFDFTQQINSNTLRSQGLLSSEFSKDHLIINLEGLLSSNTNKYIISRSIAFTLQKNSDNSHLFHVTSFKITRHNIDNTPEDIAQQILFSDQSNDRIIYINRVNDDTILFGNQTFPQYGCERKKITR
ncbi:MULTISPECIES: FidL-like protein [unclassified Raoultella]|uniref:FidL-like protein n=1 Tax=unclassified Raoultella TaxID=2627600 RepID=UPI00135A93E6|nr:MULTISPECIES: FidL-like protein [unclassified Raoultella]